MRMVVTGATGQVAKALQSLGPVAGLQVVTLARPDIDLERPETLAKVVSASRPDLLVSAAAYTAVDQAESERKSAHLINAVAPGVLAETARGLGAPIIHLSTDYVFDGLKAGPYVETDPTGPQTFYGETKLAGEAAVAAGADAYAVLRTAWVYAPFGKNFVRTMLRLAETRRTVGVVADQVGNPTYALDIATGVIKVATALKRGEGASGVFHMTAQGEATWADFARAIFSAASERGMASAQVDDIPTSAYPTPARRPANSRLDCGRIQDVFGVALPHWRDGLGRCLDQIKAQGQEGRA